ncbi:MAG TPA: uroporphyrinogen-III synthase [Dongiaceae bacterium]|nr:uroporphyrinogen-III synthase [Dongiaceae bacterium]
MSGKILITRPEEDAKPLADALAARGISTLIEPLLAIRVLADAAGPLAEDLAGVQAILFTSANGVRAFGELSARRDIGVLAVGDATAAMARSAGFTAVESAAGDVGDLVRLTKQRLKPEGGPLFHAAGSAVAGDLARLLGESGYSLRRRMLYESNAATDFTPPAREALLAGNVDQVVLFSPRTAATFVALAKAAAVNTTRISALCLSPAVADAARMLTWRAIRIATRPDLPSMLALIDSEPPRKEPVPPGLSQPEPKAVMSNTSSPSPSAPRASVPPSAPAAVPPQRPARARAGAGSNFLAALIGAVIAGAAVLAVIRFAPERLGLSPANIADASNNGLGVLTQQIADVSGRLAELQAQVTGLPRPPADIGQVNDRITALQGDVAALKSASAAAAAPLPGEITGLPQRLADLEVRIAELKPADLAGIAARLSALEQRPAGAPADAAALDQIKADLAAFDQRLKAAESAAGEVATLKQTLSQLSAASAKSGNGAAGIVLAMDALQRLIAQGKPYAAPITALESFAGGDPQLASALSAPLTALKANADKGVAPLSDLQSSFPATADAIAHAASSVAETTSPDATFGERVLARLSALVTIRPEGENAQGDDPLARLARAETRLNAGDVQSAASELSALPAGPIAEAAAPWLARARARLDAEAALASLQDATLAAFAKSAGGAQ